MAAEGAVPPKPAVKQDWYQTDSEVVVNLMTKNLKKEEVSVEFSDKSFRIKATLADRSEYEHEVILLRKIKSENCSYKVMSTKVEIRLHKDDGGQWATLETQDKEAEASLPPTYPTSSKNKKDWDALEKEVIQEEKNDPGDVNSLFSKIYESGDDNTKKAMIKSLSESGGTVLSTNWEDIGKKKTECSPPDGMEWKKWE